MAIIDEIPEIMRCLKYHIDKFYTDMESDNTLSAAYHFIEIEILKRRIIKIMSETNGY
jgi:hypothetical protein